MAAQTHSGGCFCGHIRYEAIGEATNLCFCHCTSCRRAIGAPVVPWGTFATDRFTIIAGLLAEHHSSPGVTRGFCRDCGTSLTYRNAARANEIDVALGTLDDPAALKPQMHIWVQDKLPWIVIADGLPQFATTMDPL